MEIRVPDHVVSGTFANAVPTTNSPEVVTLDFLVDVEPDVFVAVQRIRLAPSTLEALYLELGNHLHERPRAMRAAP